MATTRWIEIDRTTTTNFYFACWLHGITMGGIMDISNSAWGAITWGTGDWGDQGNFTQSVTGQSLTTGIGSVSVSGEINSGWGRQTWNENAWGIQGDALLTGQSIATGIGSVTASGEIKLLVGVENIGAGENMVHPLKALILLSRVFQLPLL